MREPGGSGLGADLLKGAVAGAAAVWVMDRVDWFMFRQERPGTRARTRAVRPGGMDPAHVMADAAAGAVGARLAPRDDNPAGLAVHYGLGILPGAVYGTLRPRVEHVDAGRGLAYGFAMFVVEDELANPLLGTAAPPGRYPWQDHARGLVAHLVLGFVTDAVCRALDTREPPRRSEGRRYLPG